MNKFWKGFLTGAAVMLVLCFLVLAAFDAADYNREAAVLQERKDETEQLLEDYGNRDPYEFLDDIPGARGAADNGIERINRKRDEIIQRQRNAGDN
jgi:hypothetical protein